MNISGDRALEMNRQLARLNARLHDELPATLQREVYIRQRMGITHGMVFATEAGWRARREYTVMGDDVNLAARLMGKGEMGQILINARMWERIHLHFETEALAPFMLKGKSEPTQAYLVKTGTASIQHMSPTSDTLFVGRDMQILTLTYGLQQAKGPRRRQGFTLQGEPGVGKTRMAKHVADAAEKARFKVAWANCQIRYGQTQGIWAALVDQLLELEQAKSDTGKRRLLNTRLDELGLPELEPALSQLVFGSFDPVMQRISPVDAPLSASSATAPESPRQRLKKSGVKGLVDLLVEEETPAEETAPTVQAVHAEETPSTPEITPDTISDSIVKFLYTYADRTATLVVLDDIHLAAPTVRSVLARVVSEIPRARLMVLVTHAPAVDLALTLPRAMTVTDLDNDESRELIARILGVRKVGPRLFDLVWNRTRGRPLFIESLLRLLEDDGHVVRTEREAELAGDLPSGTLPDNVRELILSQYDRLPGEARLALQAASVLGPTFTLNELAAIRHDQKTAQLQAILNQLIQIHVLDQHPNGSFRFRHGVTETTLYDTLNRHQRRTLHRAAASYWAEQPASTGQIMSTAYHLAKAGANHEAVRLICTAADQSQDHERAAEICNQGLALFPDNTLLQEKISLLGSSH